MTEARDGSPVHRDPDQPARQPTKQKSKSGAPFSWSAEVSDSEPIEGHEADPEYDETERATRQAKKRKIDGHVACTHENPKRGPNITPAAVLIEAPEYGELTFRTREGTPVRRAKSSKLICDGPGRGS